MCRIQLVYAAVPGIIAHTAALGSALTYKLSGAKETTTTEPTTTNANTRERAYVAGNGTRARTHALAYVLYD